MVHEDRSEIIDTLNLYGFAVDSQQWDLFDRIFTPDCEADFSESAHWHDRTQFRSDFAAFHDGFDTTQHAMMSHVVTVDGDAAHSLCNGTWRLVRKATDGANLWDGSGWYDDCWVRTAEGWRIAHRICRITWWVGNPAVQETIPGVKFDLSTTSLRRDAEQGKVNYFNALNG